MSKLTGETINQNIERQYVSGACITCPCNGKSIKFSSFKGHKKSQQHKKYIAERIASGQSQVMVSKVTPSNLRVLSDLIESIKEHPTIESLLSTCSSDDNNKEKGLMYQAICNIMVKCGVVYDNKYAKHMKGNLRINDYKQVIDLKRYMDETCINNSNADGPSDVTLKFNNTWGFTSVKYINEDAHGEFLKMFGVSDILSLSDNYKNKLIIVFGKDKKKIQQRLDHAHLSEDIKNKIHMYGIAEMNTRYTLFTEYLNKYHITRETINQYFSISKRTFKCRFHQDLFTRMTIEKYNDGHRTFLFGWKPRSGKTYGCGNVILEMLKIKGKLNVMIVTPAPSETISQFVDMFHKYVEFERFNIINIREVNKSGKSALKSIKVLPNVNNIIVVSKQWIDGYTGTQKVDFGINFDVLVFDEMHFTGTTQMSKNIINSYCNEHTLKLFLTATYIKPLKTYEIEDSCCYYWSVEDEMLCKSRNVDKLCELHGETVKLVLGENYEEKLAQYDKMPDMRIMTYLFKQTEYEDILRKTANSEYGYSMSTLFSLNQTAHSGTFNFPNEVKRILELMSGSNRETDYPNGDLSMFGRIKNSSHSHNGRTLNGEFTTQLWFLPFGCGMKINEVSIEMKRMMSSDRVLKNYDIWILNGETKDQRELKTQIKNKENTARENGKDGLIILLGKMCVLGITLKYADIVVLFNDTESGDEITQMMYRCMNESNKHKPFGYVIDMSLSRVVTTTLEYASVRQVPGSKGDKIEYLIKNNLINIDNDLIDTHTLTKSDIITRLTDIWRQHSTDNIERSLKKLTDGMSEFAQLKNDARFVELVKQSCVCSISSSDVRETLHIDMNDESDEQTIQSGSTIHRVTVPNEPNTTHSTTAETTNEIDVDKQIKFLNQAIPDMVICMTMLVYLKLTDGMPTEINLLHNHVREDAELLTTICEKLNKWHFTKDIEYVFNDTYIIHLMNIISFGPETVKIQDNINDVIFEIKDNMKSLINEPQKLIQYVNAVMSPRNIEKKTYGEVFTPLKLVNEMLNRLDDVYIKTYKTRIFSNPSLKWFDPANGIGNFAIVLFYKLMDGLREVIPHDQQRKHHILEQMLYVSELNPANNYIYRMIMNANGQYKLNINEGDSLKLDVNERWGIDKFDAVIGNPPYQEDFSNTADPHAKPLYHKFVMRYIEHARMLTFIIPSKWFSSQDKQLLMFKNLMFESGKLVYLTHYENAKSIFHGVDIKGGVCHFLYDEMFIGKCTFNNITVCTDFDIPVKTTNVNLVRIIQNVCNICGSLSSLYRNQSEFGIKSNEEKVIFTLPTHLTNAQHMYYKCVVSSKNKTFKESKSSVPIGYISKTHVDKYRSFWKVITYSASFSGSSGFGKRFIGDPNTLYNKSCISFSTRSQEEAQSLFSYMNTKFVNFMLSLRKSTHNITNKKIVSWIPLVPLDRKWTDEDVFNHFNLPFDIRTIINNAHINYEKY
jgi:hypothetical protein